MATALRQLPRKQKQKRRQQIASVRGKYADVPTSSAKFAARKQREIARENNR